MSANLEPGYILKDRYRIEDKVGEGGFSVIYLARDNYVSENPDEVINKPLVIKESKGTIDNYERFNEVRFMFEREFRTLQQLSNPHIPCVYDFFDKNGKVYYVREYISGEVLEDIMIRKILNRKIVQYSFQMVDILEYLHSQGIIYRDLKPGNLIVTPEDYLILFDFGASHFYSPGKLKDTIELGTPGYAAPEQYRSSQSDPRVDIYSFGATLHYMLTGVNPEDIPFKFKPPHEINSRIPRWLSEISMKCLELDPEKRFQGVDEIRWALNRKSGIFGIFTGLKFLESHQIKKRIESPWHGKGMLYRIPRNESEKGNETFISSKYRHSGNFINSFKEKDYNKISSRTIFSLLCGSFIIGFLSLFSAVLGFSNVTFEILSLGLFIWLLVIFVIIPIIVVASQAKLPCRTFILDIYENVIVLCKRKDPLVEVPDEFKKESMEISERIIYKTYVEEFLWSDIKALEYTIKEKNSGSDVVIITEFKEIKLHLESDIKSLISYFSERGVDVREIKTETKMK
ncbi:MAG: serine/threonine protein kinase [Candidatus Eremiobacteraeota bacterium]|nr:serine/threonine protein kinase [Candidatus Eremiobacteraeota bacterium]